MDYELPTKFDLIVVGTGMIESIVAAAASRIGKQVLHLDRNDYYGGQWASFNFEGINKLNISFKADSLPDNLKQYVGNEDKYVNFGNNYFNIKDVEQKWHIPESITKDVCEIVNEDSAEQNISEDSAEQNINEVNEEGDSKKEITQEFLINISRKFNIDISPKLQFARGEFVKLLISSNIARYSEFRSVSRILTLLNKQLEVVPCSRSDVFSNPKVTVIEKRMLMKLLTSLLDGNEDDFKAYNCKTFHSYLKDKKLTPNLLHYVLYALAMSDEQTPFQEGTRNIKRFLNSLGFYGKTPLLYSMYGSGEMPQAFCRLSAVFGGVYALNQNIYGVIVNNENICTGLLSGEQNLTALNFVIGSGYIPESFINKPTLEYISHGIFITDKSLSPSEKQHLTLLLYPPEDGHPACTIIEMSSATGTCPDEFHLLHMFTKQQKDSQSDLEHCCKALFDISESPKIIWSLFYAVPNYKINNLQSNLPKNIYACSGPDMDLDFDFCVSEAKSIFKSIYPDEEFLPRAPDPEEIIIGEETEESEKVNLLENKDVEENEIEDSNTSENLTNEKTTIEK